MDDLAKEILENFKKAFFDSNVIETIAKETVETIRKRTLTGRGLSEDGNSTVKLKALSLLQFRRMPFYCRAFSHSRLSLL